MALCLIMSLATRKHSTKHGPVHQNGLGHHITSTKTWPCDHNGFGHHRTWRNKNMALCIRMAWAPHNLAKIMALCISMALATREPSEKHGPVHQNGLGHHTTFKKSWPQETITFKETFRSTSLNTTHSVQLTCGRMATYANLVYIYIYIYMYIYIYISI